jgi:hypothetical protein
MSLSKGLSLAAVWLLAVSSALGAESYRFSVHKAMDDSITQHIAGSYLIPKGWKAVDTIKWNLMQQDAPLMVAFVVTSPDDRFAINYVNSIPRWYTRLPASSAAKSAGTQQPQQPTDVVLDNFKNNHPGIEVQILNRKEVPIPSIFKPAATMETRSLRCTLKLGYTKDGVPTETMFGFDYQADDFGTLWGRQHGFSNGRWYMNNVVSITGPQAEFEKAMKLAVVTVSSQREDPVFYEFYQEICNMLAQQMIQATNEKLKAAFDHMQEYFKDMSERTKEQFAQQQLSKDDSTRGMCDFALDRSRWTDGQNVFLTPNTVDHVVTNGSEIILQTGPQYQEPGHWEDMKKIN